jgi:hypothetical protein
MRNFHSHTPARIAADSQEGCPMTSTAPAPEMTDDTEEETGRKRRFKAPKYTPHALIGLLALAVVAVLTVALLELYAAVLAASVLPWWALLLIYSGPAGALARAARSARHGWTAVVHQWATYRRWAHALTV